MTVPTFDSPTHADPRITSTRFKNLLKTKNSPAVPESDGIFTILDVEGIDPSFALAQFRVESQYGTSGHAAITGSWGNMLYDKDLTKLSGPPYTPGNGYVYATYANYLDAITDYCRYLHWYQDEYGLTTIYEATWRWLGPGKPMGNPGHLSYTSTVVNDMIEYEYPGDTFYDTGDEMIYAGGSVGTYIDANGVKRLNGVLKRRYPVVNGVTKLYKGPSDSMYHKTFDGKTGTAWYLGEMNGSNAWGAVLIGIPNLDPNGSVMFIKDIDPAKIVLV